MHQFGFSPIHGNNNPIEVVSVKGRTNIATTDFVENFFEEPLKSIKIAIDSESRREIEVSFYTRGNISKIRT